MWNRNCTRELNDLQMRYSVLQFDNLIYVHKWNDVPLVKLNVIIDFSSCFSSNSNSWANVKHLLSFQVKKEKKNAWKIEQHRIKSIKREKVSLFHNVKNTIKWWVLMLDLLHDCCFFISIVKTGFLMLNFVPFWINLAYL